MDLALDLSEFNFHALFESSLFLWAQRFPHCSIRHVLKQGVRCQQVLMYTLLKATSLSQHQLIKARLVSFTTCHQANPVASVTPAASKRFEEHGNTVIEHEA